MASANWNNSSKSSQQNKTNNNSNSRRKNSNANSSFSTSGRSSLNERVASVIDQYSNPYDAVYDSLSLGSLNLNASTANNSFYETDSHYSSYIDTNENRNYNPRYRYNDNNNNHKNKNNTHKNNNKNNANNAGKMTAAYSLYVSAKEIDEKYTCGVCHTILDSPYSPNVCNHT
jgi:hypothetical protein